MHDLQELKKDYIASSHESRGFPPLQLGDLPGAPSVLLMPMHSAAGQSSDHWKGVSLVLLMLLGLGTSAFAYALNAVQTMPASKHLYSIQARPTAPVYRGPDHEPALLPTLPVGIVAPDADTQTEFSSRSAPPSARAQHASRLPTSSKRIRRTTDTSLSESSTNSCDEVQCLVDSSLSCCPEQSDAAPSAMDREEQLAMRPYKVSRSQAKRAFASIQSGVRRCFDSHGYQGIANVTIRIDTEGKVTRASTSDGSATFQECLQSKVSSLQFPKLRQPFTLHYPFLNN